MYELGDNLTSRCEPHIPLSFPIVASLLQHLSHIVVHVLTPCVTLCRQDTE